MNWALGGNSTSFKYGNMFKADHGSAFTPGECALSPSGRETWRNMESNPLKKIM